MYQDTTVTTEEKVTNRANFSLARTSLAIGLSLVLASAAFFSGLHIGGTSPREALLLFAGDAQPDPTANLQEFWRVWELLDEKFAMASGTESLTAEQKMQGAIDGLVAAYGDPYTTYFPPKEAEAFNEDISGNFSGVGMEVGMRNDLLTIIAPLSGTPAEKAGLLAGDAILEINGTSTERMGVDEAVRLIRGEEGTVVTLTIYRAGDRETREISVTRAKIEIPTVKTEIRDGVYILTLYSFNALAEQKFEEALRDYSRSSATKFVVDLRGNPGGYLQSAVSIASYFMPAGKVVLRENFGDERAEEIYRSYGRTIKDFAPKEVVVLIDGGSASASEILAGALQEQGYATVVGQPSFGKGSVQELVDLPGGSSLKVTIARWLTPNGTSISNGGLTPDIAVTRTIEDREANLDPQLDAAIAVAKGTYVSPVATSTDSVVE